MRKTHSPRISTPTCVGNSPDIRYLEPGSRLRSSLSRGGAAYKSVRPPTNGGVASRGSPTRGVAAEMAGFPIDLPTFLNAELTEVMRIFVEADVCGDVRIEQELLELAA